MPVDKSIIYRGSTWRKWDLHVHSPVTYGGSFDQFVENLGTAEAEVIGINDYCTISGYENVVSKSSSLGDKILFPVIEFRMNNMILDKDDPRLKSGPRINFHIIFDNDRSLISKIKTWLASLNCFYEGGRKEKVGNISNTDDYLKIVLDYFEVVKSLEEDENLKNRFLVWLPYDEYGGIDNIDPQNEGYFKLGLINKAHIIGSSNKKQIDFFLWKNDKHTEDEIKKWLDERRIPCIKGSDAQKINYPFGKLRDQNSQPIDKYCWIKADTTFEGLKQIIYEPAERIYIGEDDPRKFTHHLINSFLVENDVGGKFFIRQSQKIYFNPAFVAFIGPRGSGKSVLFDSIVLAMDQRKVNKDSYVSCFLERNKKSDFSCLSSTQGGSEGSVMDYQWSADRQGARFPFEYFPQKKIGRLAEARTDEERKELGDFIYKHVLADIATDSLNNVGKIKDGTLSKLMRNRNDIVSQEKIILSEKKIEGQLIDLNKQLESYSREGLRNLYEKRKQITKLNEQINRHIDLLETKGDEYEDFLSQLGLSEIKDIAKSIDEEIRKITWDEEFVKEQTCNDFKIKFNNLISEFISSIDVSKNLVLKIKTQVENYRESLDLEGKRKKIEDEIKNHSKELKIEISENVDNIIRKLQVQITNLEGQKSEIENAKKRKKELIKQRKTLLDDYLKKLSETEKLLTNAFTIFCDGQGKILNHSVKIDFDKDVRIDDYVNSIESNKKLFSDEVGRKFPREKLRKVFENTDIQNVVEAFREQEFEKWKEIEGIGDETINYLKAIENSGEIALLLEEKLPFLMPTIKWRDRGGNYKLLSECSVGERSTAVLSIILVSGNSPLLVDQPEEDLDNFYISERLIPIIKTVKKQRQIIFATHNANIVVNGDAELILILRSADGKHAEIEPTTIEDLSKRKEIINILEGGRDAFTKREQKLNPKII